MAWRVWQIVVRDPAEPPALQSVADELYCSPRTLTRKLSAQVGNISSWSTRFVKFTPAAISATPPCQLPRYPSAWDTPTARAFIGLSRNGRGTHPDLSCRTFQSIVSGGSGIFLSDQHCARQCLGVYWFPVRPPRQQRVSDGQVRRIELAMIGNSTPRPGRRPLLPDLSDKAGSP